MAKGVQQVSVDRFPTLAAPHTLIPNLFIFQYLANWATRGPWFWMKYAAPTNRRM